VQDSFVRALVPALSLQQLLAQGPILGLKLRERRRTRVPQMQQLVDIISKIDN
jgi:hypothetical protein